MKTSNFFKTFCFLLFFMLPNSFATAEEHKIHLYLLEVGGYFPTNDKLEEYMSRQDLLDFRNYGGPVGIGMQVFSTVSTKSEIGLGFDYAVKELVADYYKEEDGSIHKVAIPAYTSHDVVYWSLDLLARHLMFTKKPFKAWLEGGIGYHSVGFGVSGVPDLFKSSFGVGMGGRLELVATRWFSLFVRGQYKYVVPVNFGTRVIEKGVVPEFKKVGVSGFSLRGGIGFHVF